MIKLKKIINAINEMNENLNKNFLNKIQKLIKPKIITKIEIFFKGMNILAIMETKAKKKIPIINSKFLNSFFELVSLFVMRSIIKSFPKREYPIREI